MSHLVGTVVTLDTNLVIEALSFRIADLEQQMAAQRTEHVNVMLTKTGPFGRKLFPTVKDAEEHYDTQCPDNTLANETWKLTQLLNACNLHSGDVVQLSIHDANVVHDALRKYDITSY